MKSQFAALARYPAPVRILAFLLVLGLLWLPVAAPIAFFVRDANALTLLTMPLLFIEFLVLIRLWGKWVHQDSKVFRNYGLILSQQNGKECRSVLKQNLQLILDDLANEIFGSFKMLELFTRISHHEDICVIFTCQHFYSKKKYRRDIEGQIQYHVIFR